MSDLSYLTHVRILMENAKRSDFYGSQVASRSCVFFGSLNVKAFGIVIV